MEENSLYLGKTKEVIKEFIQRDGRIGYEKMSCSSYEGFMYSRKTETSNHMITFDIRLPIEGTMIYEAASGIHVSNRAYLPAVKRYCQERIHTKYGAVNVDGEDVQFHIENCLMENPVSAETLELYETEALRVIEQHRENLRNLATGRFLSIVPVEENIKRDVREKYNFSNSIAAIRDYLSNRARRNAVCEKLDENNNTIFYCQIKTEDETFRLSFNLTDDGILVLNGSYGENAFVVPEAYRYAVADYLNDENARHKYTALSMGNDGEGVSCSICTSLLDGVIGDKTIEFMEHILLKTLSDSIEAVETIGAGLFYKEEKMDEQIEELAKMIAEKEVGKDLMGALNPFGGFPEFAARTPALDLAPFAMDDIMLDVDDEISMCDFDDDLGKISGKDSNECVD